MRFIIDGSQLEELEDVYEYVDTLHLVAITSEGKHLVTITLDEACAIADLSVLDQEIGLEYFKHIHATKEAWELGPENFACHNTLGSKIDQIISNYEVPCNLRPYIDWERYWDQEMSQLYSETPNFVFYA